LNLDAPVLLFKEKEFKGRAVAFETDEEGNATYSCDDFGAMDFHDAAVSIIVAKGYQVTLYEHCGAGESGDKRRRLEDTLTYTGPVKIAKLPMERRTSSLTIRSCKDRGDCAAVTVWDYQNFKGDSREFGVGDYYHHQYKFSDRAESLRVEKGYMFMGYEHGEFNGKVDTYLGPADVSATNMKNSYSSIRIKKCEDNDCTAVTLYDGENLGGDSRVFGVGDHSCDVFGSIGFHDRTDSLKVEAGYMVTAYEHCFNGKPNTYVGPKEVKKTEMKNRISSLRIVKCESNDCDAVELYDNNDFGGES